MGNKSFTIFGVYSPALGSVFSFRIEFSEILNREEQGNCILTGDFNIDILNDNLTQDEDDFMVTGNLTPNFFFFFVVVKYSYTFNKLLH